MTNRLGIATAALLAVSLTACGSDGGTSDDVPRHEQPTDGSTAVPEDEPSKDSTGKVSVAETVATGLEVPWGLAFLPDGTAVVTERDTRQVLTIDADHEVREVGDFGQLPQFGESGLLGVAVSPDFETDQTLFFYVTTEVDNQIVRAELRDGKLGAPKPILTGIPRAFTHDGGRLIFGPDGYLYASTGDAAERSRAQDPDSLGGKILRIDTEGRPAPDNPDPSSPVFTLGHRNVQGLAFDAEGRLWASEFGDQDFDEINLIEAGNNYGWPEVEGKGGGKRFADPQVTWRTDEASPSGLAFLDGRLWMASLRGERLWSVQVEDGKATGQRAWFIGKYGRLRTVTVAPDDSLWLTTSNRDTRGTPAKNDDRIFSLTVD